MRHTALAAALVALVALPAAPARAQGELERLGGGPGGVPQVNPRLGSFFNERAGPRSRARPAESATPGASASPDAEEASADAPSIEWNGGLLSVDCERVSAGDFLMEFNRQTGISVRLEPGVTQRITASFKNLRLERALPLLWPAASWQLVRKPNTALRATDAFAGLVVYPPVPGGAAPVAYAKARSGGMNFGPAFDVPGESRSSATPAAVGDIPVEASEPDAPAPAASPSAASAPSAASPQETDATRRRIADLVEQKLKKKR